MLNWWKSKSLQWKLNSIERENKIIEAQEKKLEIEHRIKLRKQEIARKEAMALKPDIITLNVDSKYNSDYSERGFYDDPSDGAQAAIIFAKSQMKIHGYKNYEIIGHGTKIENKYYQNRKVVLKDPIRNHLQVIIHLEDSELGSVVYSSEESAEEEINSYLDRLCEAENYDRSLAIFVGLKSSPEGKDNKVSLSGYLSLIRKEELSQNNILVIE